MQAELKMESGHARMEQACGYSGDLLRFLRHRVGSVDDASDLHQETFVRLARGGPSSIGDLRAYVFRVARNLSSDFLRAERRRRERFVAELSDTLVCERPDPEQIVLDRAELSRLREILTELPERQRLALLLYRLEGVGLKEIGARLGVSESMASRYVIAALQHCGARLAR